MLRRYDDALAFGDIEIDVDVFDHATSHMDQPGTVVHVSAGPALPVTFELSRAARTRGFNVAAVSVDLEPHEVRELRSQLASPRRTVLILEAHHATEPAARDRVALDDLTRHPRVHVTYVVDRT